MDDTPDDDNNDDNGHDNDTMIVIPIPAREPRDTPGGGPHDTPPLGPDRDDHDNDDNCNNDLVTVLPGHVVALGLLVGVVSIADFLLHSLALLLVRGAALLVCDCLANLL